MYHRKKEFDGLRFILALTVMLWHSRVYVEQLFPLKFYLFRGEIANAVFFMLSGFFVTYDKKYKNYSPIRFVYKKIKKIYPIYFVSVIYISVLYWGKRFLLANPQLLVRHLLLLQSWPFHNKAGAEFNGPTWFLSCLLFSWIITPFVKNYIEKKWFYCVVSIMVVAFIIESLIPNDCNGIWKLWPSIAYFIGMTIGDIGTNIHTENNNRSILYTIFILLFFCITEIACIEKWQYAILYLIIITFSTILFMHILLKPQSVINKILRAKYLSNGGVITMNMFIIHSPVMYTLDRIDYIKDRAWLWLMLTFSITLAISYLIYRAQLYFSSKLATYK